MTDALLHARVFDYSKETVKYMASDKGQVDKGQVIIFVIAH